MRRPLPRELGVSGVIFLRRMSLLLQPRYLCLRVKRTTRRDAQNTLPAINLFKFQEITGRAPHRLKLTTTGIGYWYTVYPIMSAGALNSVRIERDSMILQPVSPPNLVILFGAAKPKFNLCNVLKSLARLGRLVPALEPGKGHLREHLSVLWVQRLV